MKNLKKLYARGKNLESCSFLIQPARNNIAKRYYQRQGNCGIDQNGINGSDLIEFDVGNNNKITNVSFMKNLKKLDAYGDCGIDQNGINGLNLVEFDAGNNKKITNVSFMKNLKILDAWSDCGIDQNGIHGLDLVKLYTNYNKKITNVSFIKNLQIEIE